MFLDSSIKALGRFERHVVKENFTWQLAHGKRFFSAGEIKGLC